MSQVTKQFPTRIPVALHATLESAAVVNNRSLNAEVVYRLEQSFEEQPVLDDAVVQQVYEAVATKVVTQVFTTCFTKLEERLLKRLAPEMFITSVEIGGNTEEFAEAVRAFDFGTGKPRVSPTGRLSGSQPEISGLHTLPQAMRMQRCMCGGGFVGSDMHTAGCLHTGLPAGDTPTLLDRGETVIPCSPSKPLTDQEWVITGSLETMTRDRAREILMELGAVVVGSVNPATAGVVWGPGAGSKLEKANQYGVTTWNEFLFIEMIRGFGVDMPLPKSNIQLLVTPGALEWDSLGADGWTENTGSMPVQPKTVVEWRVRGGSGNTPDDVQGPEPAGTLCWTLDDEPDAFDIIYWRLAK